VSFDSIPNITETGDSSNANNEENDAKMSVSKKRRPHKPQKTLFDF
jgi:hypothetical protein